MYLVKNFSEKFDYKYNFKEAITLISDNVEIKPEGYAIDKKYPSIIYIPEGADIDIQKSSVTWDNNGSEFSLKLSPEKIYVHPSGDKFQLD